MTIVEAIETITDWINENVCPRLTFKQANDAAQAEDYPFKEVHPRAYAMFYPGKDKLPEGEDWAEPFIVVTSTEGKRNTIRKTQTFSVQLTFRTWNPGTHGQEVDGKKSFEANIEGWKDVENLMDWTLRAIENTDYIGPDKGKGLRYVASAGSNYGLMVKDGQYIDEYPYFSAFASLQFEAGIARTSESYSDLL